MNKLLKSLILEMPFKSTHTKPDIERDKNLRASILTVLGLGMYDPERDLDELDYSDVRGLIGRAGADWRIYDKSNISEYGDIIKKVHGDAVFESVADGDYVIISQIVTIDDRIQDIGLVLKRKKLLERLK